MLGGRDRGAHVVEDRLSEEYPQLFAQLALVERGAGPMP